MLQLPCVNWLEAGCSSHAASSALVMLSVLTGTCIFSCIQGASKMIDVPLFLLHSHQCCMFTLWNVSVRYFSDLRFNNLKEIRPGAFQHLHQLHTLWVSCSFSLSFQSSPSDVWILFACNWCILNLSVELITSDKGRWVRAWLDLNQ